jgi:hypothetical protein
MTNTVVKSGWRLLWLRQRTLWWLFVITLVLAWLAMSPSSQTWREVLDHSGVSDQLYHDFNLARFSELASLPEVNLHSLLGSSLHSGLVFLVFMIFITGGILQDYASDHKLSTGEFFQAAGAFFWRFVRLLIMMAIALIPIAILASGVRKWSGTLSSNASAERLGFWVDVVGFAVVLFLAMCVRLWFDVAQAHAVFTGERAMSRAAGRALRILLGHFGNLFGIYILPTIVAWVALVILIFVWARVPGRLVGFTFVLGEVSVLVWIATRLWQRASEMEWYRRRFVVAPSDAPTEPSIPVPTAPPPRMPV